MSSTNRGTARQPDDFYATPSWATRAILPHLDVTGRILEPGCGDGAIVRELVAAGVNRERVLGVEIDEGRGDACDTATGIQVITGDFLNPQDVECHGHFDLSIGNPPFGLAMDFIERALAITHAADDRYLNRDRGTVAMLLRLNFLGSQNRAPWHRAHPSDVFILPRRPSFTESLRWNAERGEARCELFLPTKNPKKKPERCERAAGHDGECLTIGTDSCEYAWFVWGPERVGRWSILEIGGAK